MANILIVDDEKTVRKTLKDVLEFEGYKVDEAEDGAKALKMLDEFDYDLVLCDVKMPKVGGMEVLAKTMEAAPETQFIMISGHGTVENAVEATKKGAFDFIPKPPDLNRLLIAVRNALEKASLQTETRVLKRKVGKTREIIGETPAIKKIKETIERVASSDARVLITGDNGTGKELVARWVHAKSNRSNAPLIEVNCAAIPSELIESELFGHEKGAFTSAFKTRIGKFEQAHGGTIFLDEIGDMSYEAQAKVLRVLQEGKINRVGGECDIAVDVRVIAATNKDLLKETDAGRFRLDLYHRLGVIIIHVPALNDRRDDIPLLAERFLKEICEDNNIPRKVITPKALEELKMMNWTGNVRELHNVMERLIILSFDKITENDVRTYVTNTKAKDVPIDLFENFNKFQEFKEHIERMFIDHKLRKYGWNVSKTAEILNIQRSHLYNKIEKYNLNRDL